MISTPPPTFEDLHLLQRRLWFEYVAAAPHGSLNARLERSGRYELVNHEEPEAPLLIYRRLR